MREGRVFYLRTTYIYTESFSSIMVIVFRHEFVFVCISLVYVSDYNKHRPETWVLEEAKASIETAISVVIKDEMILLLGSANSKICLYKAEKQT